MHVAGIIRLTAYDMTRVNEAIAYIDINYMKSINAEDLSELFRIRIKELQSGLKIITGANVHEYIIQVRIEKAKQYLSDPDYTVKQIAFAVGFKRSSHFGQLFKNLVGLTPQEYRYQIIN